MLKNRLGLFAPTGDVTNQVSYRHIVNEGSLVEGTDLAEDRLGSFSSVGEWVDHPYTGSLEGLCIPRRQYQSVDPCRCCNLLVGVLFLISKI